MSDMDDSINVLHISDQKYKLSPFVLKLVFMFVWFANLMTNLDHGSIPASTKVIKKDLGLNNA